MATKLDMNFVGQVKQAQLTVAEGLEALTNEVQRLEKQAHHYEEALKFYAGPDAWKNNGQILGRTTWHEDQSGFDENGVPNGKEVVGPSISGQVARNALAGRPAFFRHDLAAQQAAVPDRKE